MDFMFDYKSLALGECFGFKYYDLICDGDKKKIIAEMNK